ncbi:hypothetical protein HYPSUDRAFT_320781 [Hypholoma sublateritium FD-334 SS-4]|uniref:F-box domain-containing protein n=1 Tax=Hypholoma sublateritium (strain FD-334 SS-4) TaxID=945553 RepID=A0A0D2MQZ4_HYPSF|nr:hypothetical protein HYPSUDRAFT_320781 [Hypholoma sublateritium FD-334 SS-4]
MSSNLPPTLPLEIIGLIVDILASDDVPDLQSVKTCALTCKAVLPFCRVHIFASISLVFISDFLGFFNALEHSPDIATCVRHLELGEAVVKCDSETELVLSGTESFARFAQMINTFTVLESVEILQIQYGTIRTYWNEIQPDMQNVIAMLIQAPTLKWLTLRKLAGLPVTCLTGLRDNLRHLHLYSVSIENVDRRPELAPARPIHLERYSINQKCFLATNILLEATSASGSPIFEFGNLKHLRIHSKRDIGVADEAFLYKLLETAGQLSTLELEGDSVRTLVKTSRLISARHKIPQTVVLCFSDVFGSGTIVEALLNLGENVLGAAKELIIYVKGWGWALGEIDNCSRTGERLDELLTNKRAWPHLKAVKLDMQTTAWNRLRCDGDSLEDVRTLSQSFIHTHFPALSSSTSISFSFATHLHVAEYVSGPAHVRTATNMFISEYVSIT